MLGYDVVGTLGGALPGQRAQTALVAAAPFVPLDVQATQLSALHGRHLQKEDANN